MIYRARITDFNWQPMVDIVPSILTLNIFISSTEEHASIETTGTIEALSQRFGFTILSEHEWDFTGIKGGICRVEKNEDGSIIFQGYVK